MPAVPVALARPGSRRLVRLITAFAAVLTFAALLLVAGPASAHDQLLSSDPKDGATLDEQPTSIGLTFSAAPLDTGIEVALVGPDGTTAKGYDIQVDDKVVTAQLPEDLPAGKYDVAWHVVSSDGHPIDGEFTYVVEGELEPTEEPTTGASDEPETSTQEAAPVEEPADEASTPTELAGAGDGSSPSGLAVAGGIVAAVLVVLGVVVMMRRKILENDRLRQANERGSEDPDAGERPNENPDTKG
ncbi:copper resistance CopC family protein [Promicromonospora kroppenstedtii]|uniref:copper resistance CopC family protein n=1 Tax=Promicromonospora kroppenstedtii TaxID=440482 RepID=UPI0004B6CE26|nr:copper resistance CopC family protein [Promicromonospora kroppenstedtii]